MIILCFLNLPILNGLTLKTYQYKTRFFYIKILLVFYFSFWTFLDIFWTKNYKNKNKILPFNKNTKP